MPGAGGRGGAASRAGAGGGAGSSAVLVRESTAARSTGKFVMQSRGLAAFPPELFAPPDIDHWWLAEPLREIDLSGNRIVIVPPELATVAEALVVLRLGNNAIAALPDAVLAASTHLKALDVAGNALETLPESVGSAAALVELNAARNKLCRLPPAVTTLARLEILRLASNASLTALPRELGRCTRLRELDVAHCALTALPSLATCPALRVIDASFNALDDAGVAAAALDRCAALSRLDLRQDRLTRVPALPPALAELFLGFNRIAHADSGALALPALCVLDLSDNAFAALPDAADIALWRELHTLDLRNNDLSVLPAALGFLPALTRCAIDGNPLRMLRRGLLTAGGSGGASELKSYLRSRASPEEAALFAAAAEGGGGAGAGVGAADGTSALSAPWIAATREAAGAHGKLVVPAAVFASPLQHVSLEQLDGGIGLLSRLRTLVLDGHAFGSGSDGGAGCLPLDLLAACPALAEVSLVSCGLSRLPHALVWDRRRRGDDPRASSLRAIRLARNRLTSLPESLPPCTWLPPSVVALDLTFNALNTWPVDLAGLPLLEELRLDGNALTSRDADAALLGVTVLRELTLRGNRLTGIPAHLVHGGCPLLQTLDVRDNDIGIVPPEIALLPSLRALLLEGNPQRTVRQAVLERGTATVLEFLRSRCADAGTGGEAASDAAAAATMSRPPLMRPGAAAREPAAAVPPSSVYGPPSAAAAAPAALPRGWGGSVGAGSVTDRVVVTAAAASVLGSRRDVAGAARGGATAAAARAPHFPAVATPAPLRAPSPLAWAEEDGPRRGDSGASTAAGDVAALEAELAELAEGSGVAVARAGLGGEAAVTAQTQLLKRRLALARAAALREGGGSSARR